MPETAETMLKVDHLSVNYGAIKAVRDVSFDLKKGVFCTQPAAISCLKAGPLPR